MLFNNTDCTAPRIRVYVENYLARGPEPPRFGGDWLRTGLAFRDTSSPLPTNSVERYPEDTYDGSQTIWVSW